MYMRLQWHMEKKRNHNSFVDVASYTEMETEHGHDTENQIQLARQGKVNAPAVNAFIEANNTKNKNLQQEAFMQKKLWFRTLIFYLKQTIYL